MSNRIARAQRIESHRLADGGLAEINKQGRKYYYMRSYPQWNRAPVNVYDLNKSEAYKILSDTLEADLMDMN